MIRVPFDKNVPAVEKITDHLHANSKEYKFELLSKPFEFFPVLNLQMCVRQTVSNLSDPFQSEYMNTKGPKFNV